MLNIYKIILVGLIKIKSIQKLYMVNLLINSLTFFTLLTKKNVIFQRNKLTMLNFNAYEIERQLKKKKTKILFTVFRFKEANLLIL